MKSRRFIRFLLPRMLSFCLRPIGLSAARFFLRPYPFAAPRPHTRNTRTTTRPTSSMACTATGWAWHLCHRLENWVSDTLLVQGGGTLSDGQLHWLRSRADNNTAVISGTGSVWGTQNNLFVGYSGAGSQLIITNGGAYLNSSLYVPIWLQRQQ